MITSVPSLHVSTKSEVTGSAKVFIESRKDSGHSGVFKVRASVRFNPASDDYPTGQITISTDLSDSLKATFTSTSIELINSFGKHNPTIIFTGRCKTSLPSRVKAPKGCKYWVIIADNKRGRQRGTPDIVGFVVTDRTGKRIAYGTGPVGSGDLRVLAGA